MVENTHCCLKKSLKEFFVQWEHVQEHAIPAPSIAAGSSSKAPLEDYIVELFLHPRGTGGGEASALCFGRDGLVAFLLFALLGRKRETDATRRDGLLSRSESLSSSAAAAPFPQQLMRILFRTTIYCMVEKG
eukprot:scaffold244_cov172-Amphora_coffeaeformis.AAC.21